MKATSRRKSKRKPLPARVIANREFLLARENVLGRLQALEKFGGPIDGELLLAANSVEVLGARLSLAIRGEIALVGEDGRCTMTFHEPGSPGEGSFELESGMIEIYCGEAKLTIWPASSGALPPGQAETIEVQQLVN